MSEIMYVRGEKADGRRTDKTDIHTRLLPAPSRRRTNNFRHLTRPKYNQTLPNVSC